MSLDVSLEGVSKFSILVFLREDLSEGRLESREGLTDAVESGQASIRRKIYRQVAEDLLWRVSNLPVSWEFHKVRQMGFTGKWTESFRGNKA